MLAPPSPHHSSDKHSDTAHHTTLLHASHQNNATQSTLAAHCGGPLSVLSAWFIFNDLDFKTDTHNLCPFALGAQHSPMPCIVCSSD